MLSKLRSLEGKAVAAARRGFSNWTTPVSTINGREFDFIVVGAGTAGCRLAHRLTESGKANVLLVEAGGDHHPTLADTGISLRKAPHLHLLTHRHPETDWCFNTKPQKHVFQDRTTPGVSPWTRGRGVGGSGGINFMMWVRGAGQDYDTWARLGADGWDAKSVLPYFIKAENVSEAIEDGLQADMAQRGVDGVTCVSLGAPAVKNNKSYKTDLIVDGQLECFKGSGFDIGDYNDLRYSGEWVGRMQYSIKQGERSSPENVLRQRIAEGKAGGLTFATGGHVAGLLMSENGHTAQGIQLIDSATGEKVEVRARRETILSAGASGSPQILMLSGIGPRDHLEQLGITCNTNLPVGEHMSDHLYMLYQFHGGELLSECSVFGDYLSDAGEFARYAEQKTGVLSKVLGDTSAYSSPRGARKDGGPELQIINIMSGLGGPAVAHAYDCAETSNMQKTAMDPILSSCITLCQPKSRGRITLKSSNPLDHPIIDGRYYDNPDDRAAHLAAYRQAESIWHTGPFKDSKPWRADVKTDDDVREYMKTGAFHGWHACGTCRMGQSDDPSACLDPSLRVIGVDNLRVCDVSTFPVVTSGNTNAPTTMVAEKGADLVKKDHADLFN